MQSVGYGREVAERRNTGAFVRRWARTGLMHLSIFGLSRINWLVLLQGPHTVAKTISTKLTRTVSYTRLPRASKREKKGNGYVSV